MRNDKENLIVQLTFEFAKEIIHYTSLLDQQRKFTLSTQLFKCGTSVGANVREAQNAESKNDFIHKMKIASKKADEAEYWLMLCKEIKELPEPDELLIKVQTIMQVLSKIISSSKSSSNSQIFKSSN